ncbi:hypothetical protein BSZ39_05295 [Bowdeniella nasicola]|uniref:HNH nuclease domain-containing protein n=1 Tax=Bowdeniella nasicola TaxID=208480 RepID=A0A1Q5Q2X7_9ACTO|nr:HNH endonuclease signature motif containing protein [Bowdeniella nasicola]OKL54193.1 hypothetical protein BSZ39_05295 [Bowdeniella nasicola]
MTAAQNHRHDRSQQWLAMLGLPSSAPTPSACGRRAPRRASKRADRGRSARLAPADLRAIVLERDGGCVFPYCRASAAVCELHHVLAFKDGGTTNADNLVAVCVRHHSLVQHPPGSTEHWTIRIADDGLPEAIPPARIDPRQRPIRCDRHRLAS